MNKSIYILAAAVACLFCAVLSAADAGDPDAKAFNEYKVKALFLYNFVKYIEWPGEKSVAQTHTANICIIGRDPFGSELDILKKASSAQLTFNVKRDISESEIPSCHVLFISTSEEGNVSSVLSRAKTHTVLTVSEIGGFADHGGIIEMVKTQENIGLFTKNKINLRINLKTAERENLRIDAQLLEIASEVIK